MLLASGHAHAATGGNGTGAANFLEIPVGARETALGGAFTAVANNADAVYYNPAGLNLLQSPEVSFTQDKFVDGVSQQWLSGAYPYKAGMFGLGINYLSVAPFDAYDNSDNRTGSVAASDLALYFAWGSGMRLDYKYIRSVSYGATLKYISETLDTVSGGGYGLDLGVLADSTVENLRYGLNIENAASSKIKFIEEGARPPLTFRTGVTYGLRTAAGPTVRGALDYVIFTDRSGYIAVGLEGQFFDVLSVRMGYSAFGDISNGLSFGLGCVLSKYTGRNISVDYSFSPTYSFGDVHKLSVTYKFGEKRETLDSLAAEKAAVDMSLGPSSLAPEKTPSEYYLDIFNNGTLVQRRNAIAELGARGGEDSFKLLIGILKDSNPWIIRDAVLVLSKLDDKRVIAPLIELLKSDEEPIRMAAISGLARYKDPQVFAALVGCMDDKSPDVRVWAAEVLAKRNDPGAVEAIQAALKKEKDEKVRSSMMDYVRILDPSLQVN